MGAASFLRRSSHARRVDVPGCRELVPTGNGWLGGSALGLENADRRGTAARAIRRIVPLLPGSNGSVSSEARGFNWIGSLEAVTAVSPSRDAACQVRFVIRFLELRLTEVRLCRHVFRGGPSCRADARENANLHSSGGAV